MLSPKAQGEDQHAAGSHLQPSQAVLGAGCRSIKSSTTRFWENVRGNRMLSGVQDERMQEAEKVEFKFKDSALSGAGGTGSFCPPVKEGSWSQPPAPTENVTVSPVLTVIR